MGNRDSDLSFHRSIDFKGPIARANNFILSIRGEEMLEEFNTNNLGLDDKIVVIENTEGKKELRRVSHSWEIWWHYHALQSYFMRDRQCGQPHKPDGPEETFFPEYHGIHFNAYWFSEPTFFAEDISKITEHVRSAFKKRAVEVGDMIKELENISNLGGLRDDLKRDYKKVIQKLENVKDYYFNKLGKEEIKT